jgi:hypothetical protein
MSMFRSSILRLLPPQLCERVEKWTHEPRSNFNHKKHLSNTFTCILISALIKSENTKTYLLSCNHTKNPKISLSYCFSCIISLDYFLALHLLYCIVIYFIAFIFIFYLHSTPCAWQPLGGVGDARQGDRLHDENEESFYDYSLRVRYKPRVPLWRKFTLATTLCTWSPNEVAHCLVSSCGHKIERSTRPEQVCHHVNQSNRVWQLVSLLQWGRCFLMELSNLSCS